MMKRILVILIILLIICLSYMNTLIAKCPCMDTISAKEMQDSCFTNDDLKDALRNKICWVVVDGVIYDVTRNLWWTTFGYKCGEEIKFKNLTITPSSPEKERGLEREIGLSDMVGELCPVRSLEKPLNCGNGIRDNNENYLNCPQDCPAGVKDNYCVPFPDFVCDPDCNRTEDQDCACNRDGICEIGIENYLNCQIDCPSGGKDNYCDGVYDHRCDPDCRKNEDIDCGITTTTIKSTNATTTTAQRTTTTIKPINLCGDGKCEADENFRNCPSDCHSGGKDDYCDKLWDGICDPDCAEGLDPDCKVNATTTLDKETCADGSCKNNEKQFCGSCLYIPAIIIFILIIAFVIYKRMKAKNE